VPQQLLGDTRVDTRAEEQGGGTVAQVVEAHLRQPGGLEQVLEVLGPCLSGVGHGQTPRGV
jgi:hypothetical protein